MAKLWKAIPVGLALGVALIWLTGSKDTAAPIDRAGYFKSEDNDRVQAFCASGPVDRAAADRAFSQVSHTDGRITLAVIYDCEAVAAPQDRLTLAGDLQAALALVASPPFDAWQWRLQINPAGQRTVSGTGN